MPQILNAPTYTARQIADMPANDPRLRSPFNDEDLTYDTIRRQYIPTDALMMKNSINFEKMNDGAPNDRNDDLIKVSDQIYTYADKNSGSGLEDLKALVAHHFKSGIAPFRFREILKLIFVKQARFYADNGDYSDVMTVDVANKQWVDKVIMNEDRHIHPQVKLMLRDIGLNWVGDYRQSNVRMMLDMWRGTGDW
jgi:hypothetical protein